MANRFSKIRLIQAKAQGFRGFEKGVIFDFEKRKTIFIGDNGKGKSSIGELIAWILTGRNIEGKQKELNVMNQKSTITIGILTFEDQDGNIHEIERKLSSSMTIKFDYEEITQKKLDELIPLDLFLSVFNPEYFIFLNADSARKTIVSLLPKQTKEEVLAEMDPMERDKLEKESFVIECTNEYLKNRREELKEIEENRKWLEGYIGKLKQPIDIPEEKTFDEKTILNVQCQIDELNSQKPELKNLDDLLKKKNEIQEKILAIQNRKFDQDVQALNQEKKLLEQKLALEQEKVYIPANLSAMETELSVLRTEYKHVKQSLLKVEEQVSSLKNKHVQVKEGDCCPFCKQALSQRVIEVLQKELEAEMQNELKQLEEEKANYQKQLVELETKGKHLANQIQQAKAEDEEKRRKFESDKVASIQALQNQLKAIEESLKDLVQKEKEFEAQKQAEIQILKAEIEKLGIDKLQAENARIQKEFDARISAEKAKLKGELARLQTERDEVIRHEANRKALLKQQEDRIKELELREKEMKNLELQENEVREKIFLMKSFNAKQIELLNNQIKKHLKDVEIRLSKIVESTGEVKDCFEIYYKEKELKICSTSEKIRAGLEISRMISVLSGVEYPVFIDNGESITSYDDTGLFQIIEVRVEKDKPLSVIQGGTEKEIVPTTKKISSSKPKSYGYYARTTSA